MLFNTRRKQLIPYIYSVPEFSIEKIDIQLNIQLNNLFNSHSNYLEHIKYKIIEHITHHYNNAMEFIHRYIWFRPYITMYEKYIDYNLIFRMLGMSQLTYSS
jgi:hypothetical protein